MDYNIRKSFTAAAAALVLWGAQAALHPDISRGAEEYENNRQTSLEERLEEKVAFTFKNASDTWLLESCEKAGWHFGSVERIKKRLLAILVRESLGKIVPTQSDWSFSQRGPFQFTPDTFLRLIVKYGGDILEPLSRDYPDCGIKLKKLLSHVSVDEKTNTVVINPNEKDFVRAKTTELRESPVATYLAAARFSRVDELVRFYGKKKGEADEITAFKITLIEHNFGFPCTKELIKASPWKKAADILGTKKLTANGIPRNISVKSFFEKFRQEARIILDRITHTIDSNQLHMAHKITKVNVTISPIFFELEFSGPVISRKNNSNRYFAYINPSLTIIP